MAHTVFDEKVYALELRLTKKIMGKLGWTSKPLCRRIAGFKFSGSLRGREEDIEVIFTSTTPLAHSIEKIAIEFAKIRGYHQVDNANLGNGKSEWFYASGEQMKSCILQAFKSAKKQFKKGEKEARDKKPVQEEITFDF